jgi:hypothetical protein
MPKFIFGRSIYGFVPEPAEHRSMQQIRIDSLDTVAANITQRVDNFNASNTDTWSQVL